MTESLKMNGVTKALVILVLIVHFMFFLLEAVLWMQPGVYLALISQLNNPIDLGYLEQALVLKNLFINQGFYNLFVVCTGTYGFYLVINNQHLAGYSLLMVLCFFGMGAGIVLLFSTNAYVLAFIQLTSSAIAFAKVFPVYKKLLKQTELMPKKF